MNLKLLNTEIQDFISEHLHSEISKLIFKGTPFKYASIKEIIEQIEAKKKCEKKLPTWYTSNNIYYPNKLNIEQTSSETTALYKSKIISGEHLIDITGGLGVDSLYFSNQFKHVVHCELDDNLSNIANHNFKTLKTKNIDCINENGLDYLKKTNQNYDWIFVDPSRRHHLKGKVFYLKDCLPNLVTEIDTLLEYSNNILVKTSPMFDISVGILELKHVKEVHIVAINNDVKELLFVIQNKYDSAIAIKTINITNTEKQKFGFLLNDELNSIANYNKVCDYLYEPNAAILKSGAFNLISKTFKVNKLHKNTHLYTSEKILDFPGRRFKVMNVIPYQKKELKRVLKSKQFNISTRNFPENVNQLKKRYNIKDGGNDYLFFTTDFSNNKIVILANKV